MNERRFGMRRVINFLIVLYFISLMPQSAHSYDSGWQRLSVDELSDWVFQYKQIKIADILFDQKPVRNFDGIDEFTVSYSVSNRGDEYVKFTFQMMIKDEDGNLLAFVDASPPLGVSGNKTTGQIETIFVSQKIIEGEEFIDYRIVAPY